jgi:acetylornithine deacetylase/succinyl-diaminopimelate desuccinylase-like protein
MQLFFGARGVTGVELTTYGPARALHSGHYGNWAPNPAVELAHLLTSLRDRDGRIMIAGYSNPVRPVTDAERAASARVPDVDAALRSELGLAATEADNARLVDRLLLPALNVRGIASGHVGELSANAIPTTASASIDFRLVPDQTPASVRAAVEAHLRGLGYFVVADEPDLEVRRAHPRVVWARWGAGYPAARTDMELPIAREVRSVVDAAVEGSLVVVPTLGGSIPMYLFADVLKTPVIGVPVANHDNNQHAADENLRLKNLWDAIEVYAALFARLGGVPAKP